MYFESDEERAIMVAQTHDSLLLFTKVFYQLLNGREFGLTNPTSRESHILIIVRALEDVFHGRVTNLNINVPPGYFKSTLVSYFIAWCMAQYPDSHFIYASFSAELAATHTGTIKAIMQLPQYQELYGVYIDPDSRAKGDFRTTAGGRIYAAGIGGTITGINAGLPLLHRCGGMLIIDDAHKISEVHSDTVRATTHRNYTETLSQRTRGNSDEYFLTPTVHIGQRCHEDDLSGKFIEQRDIKPWVNIVLKSLDELDNPLAPEIMSKARLIEMRLKEPYLFSAQQQQEPSPAGGALFKESDFVLLDIEPEMLMTFITADTAETDKSYNDATSFTFMGVYKILDNGRDIGQYGLHIINNVELRVEPKDLEGEFHQFYSQCMLYPVKPSFCAIEKKSTGVTLLSVLQGMRGMMARSINRGVKGDPENERNKCQRFINCQRYIGSKLISLPRYGRHTARVIQHMIKISPAMTQAYDDIADTIADGVQMLYITEELKSYLGETRAGNNLAKQLSQDINRSTALRQKRFAL